MPFYEGRIIGEPTVTRRLVNTQYGPVEIQDVSLTLDNVDGSLSGEIRGLPFSLDLYDTVSAVAVVQWTGVVASSTRSRGKVTITGTNLDLSALETLIPKGIIKTVDFPLATSDAVGKCPPWVFGNVASLPLLNVRDDVIESQFDYLLSRGTVAAIRRLQRVTPGGVDPFVTFGTAPAYTDGYIELEPAPGVQHVLLNGGMELWNSGPAAAPDYWYTQGAGITVAKNTTVGQFDEGTASAAVTRAGTDCGILQNVNDRTVPTYPISWWQGRTITLNVRVRATVGTRAYIAITDSITFTTSGYHSGSGLFELLAVTVTVNPTAAYVAVCCLVVNGDTTVQFDDVRLYPKAKNWEEVLRTDLYPGYSAIRCYLRQTDSSGAFLQVVADLNGLQPERNPARAVRTILSDATHGLAQTVDAASFDAAEAAVAFDHSGLVLRAAPEVLLRFDDLIRTQAGVYPAPDSSGHERHGTYHQLSSLVAVVVPGMSGQNTDGALRSQDIPAAPMGIGSHVQIPSSPAFSGQALTVAVDYAPQPSGPLDTTHLLPVVCKTVADLAAYGFDQENGTMTFWVLVGASQYKVFAPAPFGAPDLDVFARWHGVAEAGVLRLYKNGVLVNVGTYTGSINEGDGIVYVARYSPLYPNVAHGRFDNVALYRRALSAAEIATDAAGVGLGAGGSLFLDDGGYPSLYYRMDELSGSIMADAFSGLHNGSFVGGPTLGVAGAVRTAGVGGSRYAVHFENNPAKYGVVTTPSINDALHGSITVWYKPDSMEASTHSGIVEKTIGGVVNTQWLIFQQENLIVWRLKPAASGIVNIVFGLTPEDIGRWMKIGATFNAGTYTLYRNGLPVVTQAYPSPIATGAGDLYVGILGGPIYACFGAIDEVKIYNGWALTDAQMLNEYIEDTWYAGGLLVDVAMTEARQAQAWLRQFLLLRGMRLGVTTTGAWTLVVDTLGDTPTVTLRDGPGDGTAPNLLDLHDRQRPPIKNMIKDYVIKYRKNLLTGVYQLERRRPISTVLNAHGERMGQDWEEESDVLRTGPAADRALSYLSEKALADETVMAAVEPIDSYPLFEGMRVMVIEPDLDYSGETLRIQEARKSLRGAELVLAEDPVSAFLYVPLGALPELEP